jgi:hypothetical protein
MTLRWAILGLAILVLIAGWLAWPSDWVRESRGDLVSAQDLVADGWLPQGLPAASRDVELSYNRGSRESYLRFELPPQVANAFWSDLIPVGRPTAVSLAMRHPSQMPGWDEVTLSAQLRTGAITPRRLRDGSRWYFIVRENGAVTGWHAPDVAPTPARRS